MVAWFLLIAGLICIVLSALSVRDLDYANAVFCGLLALILNLHTLGASLTKTIISVLGTANVKPPEGSANAGGKEKEDSIGE